MSKGTAIRSVRLTDELVDAATQRGREVLGTDVLSVIIRLALQEWILSASGVVNVEVK